MKLRDVVNLTKNNPDYRHLFFAHALSLIGDWLSFIAEATLMATMVPGKAWPLAWLEALRMLPYPIFAPYFGLLADRFNPIKLMVLADILRFFVSLSFLFLAIFPEPALALSLVALRAILDSLFEPANSAILPRLVKSNELELATSLRSSLWAFGIVIGTGLGGPLVTFLGWQGAFIIDALTFAGSGVLILKINSKFGEPIKSHKDSPKPTIAQTWPLILGSPAIRVLLTVRALFFLGSAFGVIIMLIGQQRFAIGLGGSLSTSWIFISRAIGVIFGPVFGAWLFSKAKNQLQHQITYGLACAGLGYFFATHSTNLLFACLSILFAHHGCILVANSALVLTQQVTPMNFQGRIAGVGSGLVTTMSAIISVLTSILMDHSFLSIQGFGIYCCILYLCSAIWWKSTVLNVDLRPISTDKP